MVKILLCCSAGMSTSLLVTKMKKVAKEKNIDSEIWAISVDEITKLIEMPDVILLGPQIKYHMQEVEEQIKNVPIKVIPMIDYGTLNGEKVLDLALSLIKE